MSPFITLHGKNATGHDFNMHVRVDQILQLHSATKIDLATLPEINTYLITPSGGYAVKESAATIRSMMANTKEWSPEASDEEED